MGIKFSKSKRELAISRVLGLGFSQIARTWVSTFNPMGFSPCSRKAISTFLASMKRFSRTSTPANNFPLSLELPSVPMVTITVTLFYFLSFLFAPSIAASSDSKSLDFYNVGMCSFSCYVDPAFNVMQCFENSWGVENK